ncbi:MATE family efflux transporter [Aestuariibius sp. 2305UL40-4]|uniref:MATE family efflux transporter n=1 Tax=Aestuariibius violaceus TaxID=3234132 RepID=UPI00345E3931
MAYADPYRREAEALLQLGLPLIGSQLAALAIGITDVIMLGRYSVDALAAGVLGHSVLFAFIMLGAGFAFAVMPLVATADAEGDRTTLRRVTRMGLWLSVGFGIVMLPLMLVGPGLLSVLGQPEELAADAGLYLQIAGLGIAPALVLFTMRSALSAVERTQAVLWATILSALVNLGLNWVLIFGRFGFPELGVAGAAIASVVVQCVGAGALALYARYVFRAEKLFSRIWRVDTEAMAQVFRLGLPIGLTHLSEVGLFAAAAIMVGWIGTVEVAAHGVALQAASVTFMFHLGLSHAATVRAGSAYGRRDRTDLMRGAGVALTLSCLFALITVLLFIALPEPIAGIFLDRSDPEAPQVIKVAVVLIFMAALFQVADGMQVMVLGLLRGLHDTAWPMGLAAGSYWLVGIPLSYVLGHVAGYGAVGVWWGLVAGLGCAGVLLMGRFVQRSRMLA